MLTFPRFLVALVLFATLTLLSQRVQAQPFGSNFVEMGVQPSPTVAPLQVVTAAPPAQAGIVAWCRPLLIEFWPAILIGVLLLVSEILSLTKLTKANGVTQLIINVVKRFVQGRPGVAEVEAALEGPLVPIYDADGKTVVGYRRKDPPAPASVTDRQVVILDPPVKK